MRFCPYIWGTFIRTALACTIIVGTQIYARCEWQPSWEVATVSLFAQAAPQPRLEYGPDDICLLISKGGIVRQCGDDMAVSAPEQRPVPQRRPRHGLLDGIVASGDTIVATTTTLSPPESYSQLPPVPVSAVTVSYSPQGAEALKALTGRVIPGVMLLHVTVDSAVKDSLQVAVYTEAARAGISVQPPDVALPLLTRTRQRNWKQIALDVGAILGGLTGTLGITNVIPISNGWSAGLSALPLVFGVASGPLRDRLPETGWHSRLCPLRVEAGASCLMLARYQQMGPKVVEVR